MKNTTIDIDQLIDCYMLNTTGYCISMYITPKRHNILQSRGIPTTLYTTSIFRFKTEQELIAKYNELVDLKPTIWINGVRQ